MITELDAVVLTRSLPARGLAAWDVGAVVHVYPDSAYEVEFVAGGGETVAVLTLGYQDLRPLLPTEILHARELAPTAR